MSLARLLHKTLGEILAMPYYEFQLWVAYFAKAEDPDTSALDWMIE